MKIKTILSAFTLIVAIMLSLSVNYTVSAEQNTVETSLTTDPGGIDSTEAGVTYYLVCIDFFNPIETPSDLIQNADQIFEGTLTGIHFEIIEGATGLPLDPADPPEGAEGLEYGSSEFSSLYRFCTVFDVSVSKTYKGEAEKQVKYYFYFGLKGYKEEEQLKLISDLGFRNEENRIYYIYITDGDYGSHLNVGSNYLFFGRNSYTGNRTEMIDQYYFAFGEDYSPYSNYSVFTENFNYKILTDCLTGNAPEGGGDSKGDLTGDGEADSSDAALLLKYDAGIMELNDEQLTAADVTGDGTVDSSDAAQILKYDAGVTDVL